MKTLLLFGFAVSCLVLVPVADSQIFSASYPVNQPVPDGSLLGLPNSQIVSGVSATAVTIRISLDISASTGSTAFLGDLYAYVEHNGQLAVLLNRPGRTIAAIDGYDDDQSIAVTFADGGPDIHNYRSSPAVPLSGSLAGIWSADGRAVSPTDVLGTEPRTAGLELFGGEDPNGTWNLFVADLSGGAQHQLVGWGLEISPVPESISTTTLTGVLLGTLALLRRRRH